MEDRSSPVSRSESDRSHEEVPDTYPRFDIADVSFVCGLRMLTQGMVLEVQSVVSDSIVKLRVRTALDRYIRRVSELLGAKRHSHSSSSPVTPFSTPHPVPQSTPTTCTPTDGIAELPYLPIPEVSALVSQCVRSPDDFTVLSAHHHLSHTHRCPRVLRHVRLAARWWIMVHLGLHAALVGAPISHLGVFVFPSLRLRSLTGPVRHPR